MFNSTELNEPDDMSSISSTSEEDMSELLEYRELKKDGYIYNKKRKNDEFTVRELLQKILIERNHTPKYIYDTLDFSYKPYGDGGLCMTAEQVRTKKHYLTICKRFAVKYKKDHKKCAPRMKKKIKTDAMVKGQTGLGNLYKSDNTKIIVDYLNKYPFDSWSKKLEPEFTQLDGLNHCSLCKYSTIHKSAMRRHLTTKKHLTKVKNKEDS